MPDIRPVAGFGGPEDRVLISDFSEIDALAASPSLVFGATPHGLLIYDRLARRFRPPVTAIDGYPPGRVRRAIADRLGNAVWLDLGTVDGYARYDVDGRVWTRGPAHSAELADVLTVTQALAQVPLADAMRAAILTDSRLRSHQFTAAAATPDRPEIFFGTNGMGVVRVDKQTGEWEVLDYGLIAPGVGALAPAPDGVWAAATVRPGSRARRGLSWVARDLSDTRTFEGGGAALGYSFLYSRRLLAAGSDLWLATEQGVLRIDPSSFHSRLFDLPDATSLARAPDGVWVGTTRGLSKITSDGDVSPIGSRELAITSLLAAGESLWVGTSAGVGQLLPGADDISEVPELAGRSFARVPIRALANARDTVVMATDGGLLWRDPDTRAWQALPLPLSLGTPTAMIADPRGGLWIGGTQGLAQVELGSAAMRVHTVPLEVPAAVRDVTVDREYLWLATDSGLVRIR